MSRQLLFFLIIHFFKDTYTFADCSSHLKDRGDIFSRSSSTFSISVCLETSVICKSDGISFSTTKSTLYQRPRRVSTSLKGESLNDMTLLFHTDDVPVSAFRFTRYERVALLYITHSPGDTGTSSSESSLRFILPSSRFTFISSFYGYASTLNDVPSTRMDGPLRFTTNGRFLFFATTKYASPFNSTVRSEIPNLRG